MTAWVAARRAGDAALDLRVLDALGQDRERLGRIVAGLHLAARAQSMVRPSSRGGVPVFSRPSAKPSPLERRGQADGRRLADPAGRNLLLADMDQPRRNVPVVRTTAPVDEFAAVGQVRTPATRPSRDDQIVGLALDDRQIRRSQRIAACIAARIKLAVGLGARAAHRRTLPAIEHPELDAALVGDPAHQAVQRVDLPDQMALAEPADGRIAGHRADGRKLVGDQGSRRAHARGRGRGFTAGVAAADHDDVEARIHVKVLE